MRRIPLSRRSHIIGFQPLPTGTAEHESALERDFVTLTSFLDPTASIISQPVTLTFRDDLRARRYTPDYLIRRTQRCRAARRSEVPGRSASELAEAPAGIRRGARLGTRAWRCLPDRNGTGHPRTETRQRKAPDCSAASSARSGYRGSGRGGRSRPGLCHLR